MEKNDIAKELADQNRRLTEQLKTATAAIVALELKIKGLLELDICTLATPCDNLTHDKSSDYEDF